MDGVTEPEEPSGGVNGLSGNGRNVRYVTDLWDNIVRKVYDKGR